MIEKRLAHTALISPSMMPLVYCVSNLKINMIPHMIKKPAIISSLEMRFLLISGSKIAVKSVIDDKQTKVTDTVETLIAAKNNTQCPPTKAPVRHNFSALYRSVLMLFLLNLKYKNSETAAIKTRYHTNCTAAMVINLPRILVNPQIKTVKWSIKRFLLMPCGVVFSGII